MKRDTGLDSLLDMAGEPFFLDQGYWCKIEAYLIDPTVQRPHGIHYSLTLHDNHNARIFGMDNAHIPKNRRKGFHGRVIEFDHTHNDQHDKGTAYAFVSAEQLLTDFWASVDEILKILNIDT